jgi:hypothetical protein
MEPARKEVPEAGPIQARAEPPRGSRRVRCRCVTCGAHVHAVRGVRLYGQCGNCGGIDLVPLEPVAFH